MMTKSDVREYIEKNGNASKVVEMIKLMHAEGAEMTLEELDKRIHPDDYSSDLSVHTIEEIHVNSTDTKTPDAAPEAPEAAFVLEAIAENANSDASETPRDVTEEAGATYPARDYNRRLKRHKAPSVASGVLTVIVLLMSLLAIFLMAVILILQVAPSSEAAMVIDTVVEKIATSFSALDAMPDNMRFI